ncbi:heavy metal translocating P-type ATPase [Rhizobium sp. LjRoot98]|uniref:heavy metal translocating P-type ATPase n=1 Tax=unclassified Rhizobium TaxID=2613769 RepID=UPI000714052D|nr:heavy metal translocating P-type ATPase [Rhizobium sp. Root1204]KQV36623.1 nitrogen fixation protein FixI [Rhizobium sp. Root1204]
MTCCAPTDLAHGHDPGQRTPGIEEVMLASRDLGDGLRQVALSVPDMRCGACMVQLEMTLARLPDVRSVRANLTTKRVTINWQADNGNSPDFAGSIGAIGYTAVLPTDAVDQSGEEMSGLLRALAVAGFCSMNIMILSVSVWSGADPSTRQALHMMSAALALPAVIYSGATFYRSAWRALVHGRVNMDVPISIGVLLSFGLSLYDTFVEGRHAYFEASTSLLFVLLVGRTLDHMMRKRARSAAAALADMMPKGANVVRADGRIDYVPLNEIGPGTRTLIAAGDRIPADGTILSGISELDRSMLTGESRWESVAPGAQVRAGDLNVGHPLTVEATAAPENSTLAELHRMLEAVEDGRSAYRTLIDRAARLYAPVVHGLSVFAFVIWFVFTRDIHLSLTIAISVLIIACPCALGLAVPMVQVVAARRLFKQGIVARDGSALERLAEIDTVVFDKTGTLTQYDPMLAAGTWKGPLEFSLALSLAKFSSHPMSKAVADYASRGNAETLSLEDVRETPGNGLEATFRGERYRLGRSGWETGGDVFDPNAPSTVVLTRRGGEVLASFQFGERVRAGSAEAVQFLEDRGIAVRMLTGDVPQAANAVARELGIDEVNAAALPKDKAEIVEALQHRGRKVLMIGDGINDALALKTARVSMAPASGSDIGRSAADFILLNGDMDGIRIAMTTAGRAAALIRQNFALAIVYNVVSIPLALSGYASPLIAAVAMSTSSILVVANAVRLDMDADVLSWRRSPTAKLAGAAQ